MEPEPRDTPDAPLRITDSIAVSVLRYACYRQKRTYRACPFQRLYKPARESIPHCDNLQESVSAQNQLSPSSLEPQLKQALQEPRLSRWQSHCQVYPCFP